MLFLFNGVQISGPVFCNFFMYSVMTSCDFNFRMKQSGE